MPTLYDVGFVATLIVTDVGAGRCLGQVAPTASEFNATTLVANAMNRPQLSSNLQLIGIKLSFVTDSKSECDEIGNDSDLFT